MGVHKKRTVDAHGMIGSDSEDERMARRNRMPRLNDPKRTAATPAEQSTGAGAASTRLPIAISAPATASTSAAGCSMLKAIRTTGETDPASNGAASAGAGTAKTAPATISVTAAGTAPAAERPVKVGRVVKSSKA
jgi:hypothetical protein